ncbi:MAG: hypothetical protein R3F56_07125 [Planctomycetota bacterium]
MDLLSAWIFPVLLGHAALRVLVAPGARRRAGPLVVWASAVPLGLGLTSVLTFATICTLGPSFTATLAVEGLTLLGSWALAWRAPHHASPDADPDAARSPGWLRALVAAGLLANLVSFAIQARDMPFGDADGIGIWGNRAVFLNRACGAWDVVFADDLVHTDYPLLLPLLSMRAWRFTGDETHLAGLAVALVFTACGFALLGGGVARLRGGRLGSLATLALCATPFFVVQGAAQTGDVPLSCFALACAVWMRLGGAQALPAAGAFAGLAAWTKNEGLLVAGALVAFYVAGWVLRDGWRVAARAIARTALGAVPALFAWAAFKLWLAPRNDLLVNSDSGKALSMLTSGERWRAVARAYGSLCLSLRGAGAAAGLGPVTLAAAAILLGRQRGARFFGAEVGAALSVVAVEFGIFLLTPYDLSWHLGTALDRLFLQVWPLALFGAFLWLRDPVTSDRCVGGTTPDAQLGA